MMFALKLTQIWCIIYIHYPVQYFLNTLSLSIPGVYRKMLQKMKVQEFVSVIYLQVVRPIS